MVAQTADDLAGCSVDQKDEKTVESLALLGAVQMVASMGCKMAAVWAGELAAWRVGAMVDWLAADLAVVLAAQLAGCWAAWLGEVEVVWMAGHLDCQVG